MNKLMGILLGLVLTVTPMTSTNAAELICTREYMPVCGIDGVTYGNKCMAGDTVVAYQGECARGADHSATKPEIQTSCASYNDGCNTCHAGVDGLAACTLMFCAQPGQPYCLIEEESMVADEEVTMCTMQYDPVCGMVDGEVKTYGNSCVAGAEKATVVHNGECVTPVGSINPMSNNQKVYRDSVLVKVSDFSTEKIATIVKALQTHLEEARYLSIVSIMTPEQNRKHVYLMTVLSYLIEKLSMGL